MRQTVFGTDRAAYQKKLHTNILLCTLVFFSVASIHIICTCFRTQQNHTYMLIANIAADIIGGSFLIAQLSMCVFPQKKMLQLYDQATQETAGQVLEMGNTTTNYIGMECCEVSLLDRCLFLPINTIVLTVGQHYHFRLKGNLIVEVFSDE